MWHKIVVVLHISALFDAHKVLHWIKILPGARACQKFLHGHSIAQEHRHELKQRTGNTGSRSSYPYLVLSILLGIQNFDQLTRCPDDRTWFSGTDTLTLFSSSLDEICSERLLEPLFDLDSNGGLLFVAPRPANRLFSKDGLRAQINAWKDDTVKTPSLFNVCFVARDTCVSRLWGRNEGSVYLISSADWARSIILKVSPWEIKYLKIESAKRSTKLNYRMIQNHRCMNIRI